MVLKSKSCCSPFSSLDDPLKFPLSSIPISYAPEELNLDPNVFVMPSEEMPEMFSFFENSSNCF